MKLAGFLCVVGFVATCLLCAQMAAEVIVGDGPVKRAVERFARWLRRPGTRRLEVPPGWTVHPDRDELVPPTGESK